MKIINKSGKNDIPDPEGDFYVLLSEASGDIWEGDSFYCTEAVKYSTEENAIEHASIGQVVAKVTLVAKIV